MTANASPPLLEALDVSYTYPGLTPTQALEGLSLEVKENEFLALLGPVGCGKTTLLRIFAGFLRPTKGSVRCAGSSIEGPGWQRGYVLQEPSIFPWMTVRENLEFGLLAKGVAPAARRVVSDELLVQVDRNFIARHHNAETIPFANRLVGELRRPGRAFLIII